MHSLLETHKTTYHTRESGVSKLIDFGKEWPTQAKLEPKRVTLHQLYKKDVTDDDIACNITVSDSLAEHARNLKKPMVSLTPKKPSQPIMAQFKMATKPQNVSKGPTAMNTNQTTPALTT